MNSHLDVCLLVDSLNIYRCSSVWDDEKKKCGLDYIVRTYDVECKTKFCSVFLTLFMRGVDQYV